MAVLPVGGVWQPHRTASSQPRHFCTHTKYLPLKAEQVWETRAIAPYYNDLVVHKGHIYGFHNNLLACLDVETGKPLWKERGYDNGQVLLLPNQDLLLVLSEKGEVALVEAYPGERRELGR